MNVSDVMTTNVTTIPSSTSIADAKRIMTVHKIDRLPVVDKGKLVGIVTSRRLEQVSPSQASSLTVWELGYVLEKTTVKEIMEKHVVTVTPDMMVEEAVATAQSNKVGALVVLEDSRVIGIVTTNDFFYKLLNPILGVAKFGTPIPGCRIDIIGGGEGKAIEEIMSIVNKLNLKINNLAAMPLGEDATAKDLFIHLENTEVKQLISELEAKGYRARVRKYS